MEQTDTITLTRTSKNWVGNNHSLLLSNNKLHGFGNNKSYCLGSGENAVSLEGPFHIGQLNDIIMISGCIQGLALTFRGEVYAWGGNTHGEVGIEKPAAVPTKLDIPSIKQVACGWGQSIAVSVDGNVWAWGLNVRGQLGLGGANEHHTHVPTKIPNFNNIVAIACGANHTFAINSNGDLFAWGDNAKGQLGLGSDFSQVSTPKLVPDVSNVLRVACGGDFSLVLLENGDLYATGENEHGELGLGHGDVVTKFTLVGSFGPYSSISCGRYHSMLVTEWGDLFTWGSNAYGQLGIGSNEIRFVPTKILSGVSDIASGFYHSLAVKDGDLYVWGKNRERQLAKGDVDLVLSPEIVNFELEGAFCWTPNAEKSVYKLMSSILNCERYHDILITVGAKNFYLHKPILKIRCPKLIDYDRTPLDSNILSFDCSSEIFEVVIKFVYTNVYDPVIIDNLPELIKLAKMFEIPELVLICQRELKRKITVTNVIDALVKFYLFQHEKETNWIVHYIGINKQHIDISRLVERTKPYHDLLTIIMSTLSSQIHNDEFPEFVIKLRPLEEIMVKLLNGVYSDFKVIVGGDTLNLHKCILSQWGYFDFITEKHFKEYEFDSLLPKSAITKLLKYFYTYDTSDLTLEDSGWILSIAPEYCIDNPHLLNQCQLILNTHVTEKTWQRALRLSIDIGMQGLKERAIKAVPSNVSVHDWLPLLADSLESIKNLQSSVRDLQIVSADQKEKLDIILSKLNL